MSEGVSKIISELFKAPDASDAEESQEKYTQQEIDRLIIDNDLRREELENRKQDRAQRKTFAKMIFWFLCAYMLIVMALIYFSGFKVCFLSNNVLITLLTTTTANIIGIFLLVVKYLFAKG
jgi:cation transport ATPase